MIITDSIMVNYPTEATMSNHKSEQDKYFDIATTSARITISIIAMIAIGIFFIHKLAGC